MSKQCPTNVQMNVPKPLKGNMLERPSSFYEVLLRNSLGKPGDDLKIHWRIQILNLDKIPFLCDQYVHSIIKIQIYQHISDKPFRIKACPCISTMRVC